jgi:hypothetical protein
MIEEHREILLPFFLTWNLRNIVDTPSKTTSDGFGLIGTKAGEYPIDDWEPYYLEIPQNNGTKKDLNGRMNKNFNQGLRDTRWNLRRIVSLPEYVNSENADLEVLKLIVKYWKEIHIPDDIPVLAIAVKCKGNYSDVREAQCVQVLLIWNDGTSRITTMEWFEGPLEDCITPEWYIKTTGLLSFDDAIPKMRNICNSSNWSNPVYSILTLPSNLVRDLRLKAIGSPYGQWNMEMRYRDHSILMKDLDRIFYKIRKIFSIEEVC